MEILRLHEITPGSEPYNRMLSSMVRSRLVPFIGSGFSMGLSAGKGCVPGAEELKEKLTELLRRYNFISTDDYGELLKMDFYDVADYFMRKCADSSANNDTCRSMKVEFKRYVVSNFIGVSHLPSEQVEFLSCGWPYVYTLNYDDAIECALPNYDKIVPYRPLDRDWLESERHCLIKLHGDACEFQISNDFKYFIMGKSQYLNAIDRDENMHLMDWIRDDYASKDILFVGCGLHDELDILFAGQRANRISDPTRQAAYYVHYDRHPENEIPFATRSLLDGYGIGSVIRVEPNKMADFYRLIANMSADAQKAIVNDALAEYRGREFTIADASPKANLEYLFSNKPLGIDGVDKRITLPYFYVERDVVRRVYEDLAEGSTINLVLGNRFAGKTYVLLGLLRALSAERDNVYYFAGTPLSDESIREIKKKSDCLLIFDSNALTSEQIRDEFCRDILRLREHGVQAVFAVSTAEKSFFYGLLEEVEELAENGCRISRVNATLNDRELSDFRNLADKLHFVKRDRKDTFLDYAMRIEAKELSGALSAIVPEIEPLSQDYQNEVVCMIALAARKVIDVSEANRLDVREELLDLCECTDGVVQQDYLSVLEARGRGHAGGKFVSNSFYWVRRYLSEYATNPENYDSIARAYASIAARMQRDYAMRYKPPHFYYKAMMPFIYFDEMQEIFFYGASGDDVSFTLPEIIYDRLSPLLYDDFQFLHQYAKCKLRSSKHEAAPRDGMLKLEEAKRLVEKAIEFADERGGANVLFTLTHMTVTKALVLTNYLRFYCGDNATDVEALAEAVDAYHDIYVTHRDYNDLKYSNRDKNDISWFFARLVEPGSEIHQIALCDATRIKAQEAASAYYERRIQIEQ